MTTQQVKEQLGKHFFCLVASRMGCKIIDVGLDNGVDLMILPVNNVQTNRGNRFFDSGRTLAIQLKCTTTNSITEEGDFLKFDLEAKNYDDLVLRYKELEDNGKYNIPLVLVLVVWDGNPKSWLKTNIAESTVGGVIYWFYPTNELNFTQNRFSKRIKVSKKNRVSLDNFKNFMLLKSYE